MHVLVLEMSVLQRGAGEYPFNTGEELGEEEVVAGLGLEDLGAEFCGVGAPAVQEDDGVGVWCRGGNDVRFGVWNRHIRGLEGV